MGCIYLISFRFQVVLQYLANVLFVIYYKYLHSKSCFCSAAKLRIFSVIKS